ncbi:hypothetical protein BJ508DRAFT_360235 [Ascobolus immersus RN42]|uniref:Uncharacterized protein n=1 Tax=Ascobolus immersus RN42 TaxID=1160509 RepID=A0A3N4IEN4_ASCIM|nr:hypothetical protein BJ508DRAFT_360235 [Ascobolus immersus RN42]
MSIRNVTGKPKLAANTAFKSIPTEQPATASTSSPTKYQSKGHQPRRNSTQSYALAVAEPKITIRSAGDAQLAHQLQNTSLNPKNEEFPPLPRATPVVVDTRQPKVKPNKYDGPLRFNNKAEMLQMYEQLKKIHGVTDELEKEYQESGFMEPKEDWVEGRLAFLRKNGFEKLPTPSEYLEWLESTIIPESQDFDEHNPGVIAYFDSMGEEEYNASRFEK